MNNRLKKDLRIVIVLGVVLVCLSYIIYLVAIIYEKSLVRHLNEDWLSRTSLVSDNDFPNVEWVEDSVSSKGFNSFVYLDRNCDDIKYLVHTRWPLPISSYYWWKSRLGGDYFYTNYQIDGPNYTIERNDSTLHIITPPKPDTWVYLAAIDSQPDCYALDFDYCPVGDQYETLQIDVRLKSLANRLKFVIRYNRDVKFDMYMRSNALAASNDARWTSFIKPLILSKDIYSHIRIEVVNDYYSLIVNGNRIINVRVEKSCGLGDYWCLMSWNSLETIPCELIIKNFKILHKK